jgi:anti-sigma regulatory factor (Ser/Thr protein kinase)
LVAVTEACTNALVHGHEEGRVPDPEIDWEISGSIARFRIRDFALSKGSKSGAGGGPAERDGGYGLKMMRQLMDEVDIQFETKGTTVILVKYFEPQAARS